MPPKRSINNIPRAYYWGIPSQDTAQKIISFWQQHVDNVFAVQRDLGRKGPLKVQGVDEVCLALQVLINLTIGEAQQHKLLPIAKKAIAENFALLPQALQKIYYELLKTAEEKKYFIDSLEWIIVNHFSGMDRGRISNLIQNLKLKIKSLNISFEAIKNNLNIYLQFPYEFDPATGILTVTISHNPIKSYSFSIVYEGIDFNSTYQDKIQITASAAEVKARQFITFKVMVKLLSKECHQDMSAYDNVTFKDFCDPKKPSVDGNYMLHYNLLMQKFDEINSIPELVLEKVKKHLNQYSDELSILQGKRGNRLMDVDFWEKRNLLTEKFDQKLSTEILKLQSNSPQMRTLISTIVIHILKEDKFGLNAFSYEFLQMLCDKIWTLSKEIDAEQIALIERIIFATIGKKRNWLVEQGLQAVHITLQYLTLNVDIKGFSPRHQAIKLIDVNSSHLFTALSDLLRPLSDVEKPIFIERVRKVAAYFTTNIKIRTFLENYSLTSTFQDLSVTSFPDKILELVNGSAVAENSQSSNGIASSQLDAEQNVDADYSSLGFSPRSNISLSSTPVKQNLGDGMPVWSVSPIFAVNSGLNDTMMISGMDDNDIDLTLYCDFELNTFLNELHFYIPFDSELDANNVLWITIDPNTFIKFSEDNINSLGVLNYKNADPKLIKEYIAFKLMIAILTKIYHQRYENLSNVTFAEYGDYQNCYVWLYQYLSIRKMIDKNNLYTQNYQLHDQHPLCTINRKLQHLGKNFQSFIFDQISDNPTDFNAWLFALDGWYTQLSSTPYATRPTTNFIASKQNDSVSLFSYTPEQTFGFGTLKN